jgi:hypothetical protein
MSKKCGAASRQSLSIWPGCLGTYVEQLGYLDGSRAVSVTVALLLILP